MQRFEYFHHLFVMCFRPFYLYEVIGVIIIIIIIIAIAVNVKLNLHAVRTPPENNTWVGKSAKCGRFLCNSQYNERIDSEQIRS